MPLTPADIHNMAFKKPPIGKRGYDEEEVDAFLDEVEQELIRLLEENGALRDQMQRGGGTGGGSAASTMVLTGEFASLVGELERLQEARDRAEANARNMQAQLERARAESRSQSGALPSIGDDDRNARVLQMAQRTADDHMRDARKESDALLGLAVAFRDLPPHERTAAVCFATLYVVLAGYFTGVRRKNLAGS